MRSMTIEIDRSELEKAATMLRNVRGGAPQAMKHALNRTVAGMSTDAGKEVASKYIVMQRDVKAKLKQRKATASDLSIALWSKGRPIRLAKFKTRPNKNPGVRGAPTVFAQVMRTGSGGRIAPSSQRGGAFMMDYRAGDGSHSGVFVRDLRESKVRAYGGRLRSPLRQLHAPGVVQMLDNEQVRTRIQSGATKRLGKELDHQINRLLDKGARP